jgi:endonuclease/exonuclease/phosphatase family metal-dependent hydrolase
MVQSTPELRVMSFNILNCRGLHDVQGWERRRSAVAAAIAGFGPDLLGAQEVQPAQAEYLRKKLKGYHILSVGRNDGPFAGERVAIFYRDQRFQKLDEGRFWLSNTPHVPGSRYWDCFMPRTACWLNLRDRVTGLRFFLFNTHFDPLSIRARWRSAEVLRRMITHLAGTAPTIVTGDFNARPGLLTYQSLLWGWNDDGPFLIDAFRQANPDEHKGKGTFRGLRGIRSRRRIDWILHTPHFMAAEATIDRSKRDGSWPSDHFPVAARLWW